MQQNQWFIYIFNYKNSSKNKFYILFKYIKTNKKETFKVSNEQYLIFFDDKIKNQSQQNED